MDLRFATAAAAVLLSAMLVPAAQAQPTDVPASQPRADFIKLDANKDGFISRGEARADKDVARWFTSADTNRDGKLSEDEYVKGRSIDDRKKAEQYASDTEITTKIKAELLTEKGFPSTGVSVATSYGVVNLSGSVDQASQIRQAGAIAAKIKGVKTVRNSIVVK